jgi:hypothetical protein
MSLSNSLYLSTATSQDFLECYSKYSGIRGYQSEREYLNKNLERQQIAQNDKQIFETFGTTPLEVAKKLEILIEKAEAIYYSNAMRGRRVSPVHIETEGNVLDISGFDLCEKHEENCAICPHTISGPSTLTIKNQKTNEEVVCKEGTLHLIYKHGYFADPMSDYRLDPARVSRLLGFTQLSSTQTLKTKRGITDAEPNVQLKRRK